MGSMVELWIFVIQYIKMKVIPLSEGSFTIDATKVFVPFDTSKDSLQERNRGSLLVEVQPFLVITPSEILLLDTGLGFSNNGQMQIHQNLAQHGFNANDVTKVLLSHLHKDHAGGVSYRNRFGHYEAAFPNATYFVQERELNNAYELGFPSYLPDELSILDDTNRVVLLKDDEGWIDQYIHYQVTQGHSKFHQVFSIHTNNNILFFGGDDAPQLSQMKNRFVAKYDFDGKKCMELRKDWWEKGHQEHWTFLFYHDIASPSISL